MTFNGTCHIWGTFFFGSTGSLSNMYMQYDNCKPYLNFREREVLLNSNTCCSCLYLSPCYLQLRVLSSELLGLFVHSLKETLSSSINHLQMCQVFRLFVEESFLILCIPSVLSTVFIVVFYTYKLFFLRCELSVSILFPVK